METTGVKRRSHRLCRAGGALIVGIPMFNKIPETPNDLEVHNGVLSSFGDTIYYSEAVDLEREVYFIKVDNKVFYTD